MPLSRPIKQPNSCDMKELRNVPPADTLFARHVEQARQADAEAQMQPMPKAPKRGRKKR
ncbi:MAG: hypothetical protein NVS3B12_14300 [Acidimicrobiales bacterium]